MTDDTTSTDASNEDRTGGDADRTTGDSDRGETPDRTSDPVDRGLAERLDARAVSLATTDPTADLDDLRPLDPSLAEATVVGLGEATHGSREIFRLKHRLVRYLVVEHGLRAVAMEANVAEARAIDDYVALGEGNPEDALAAVYFWTWDTEEVRALLEWLRAFNEGRPLEDRVRFYGVDSQFTAGAAGALVDYLETVDPDWLAANREPLETLADEGIDVEWSTEDFDPERAGEQAARARDLVDRLSERFESRRSDYVAATDRRTYDRHRLYLWSLDRAVEYRAASHDDVAAALRARDEAMADAVEWVLDREDADRLALWAHDEHLRRGPRDTEWGDVPGMGTHLADRLGEDYYAVGFDVGRGRFQALSEDDHELGVHAFGDPPADAATRLFDAAADPRLFVDLDDLAGDDRLTDWLAEERPKRSVGAVYYGEGATESHHDRYRLPGEFDGLVFLAETTRARPIDRE